MRKLIYWYNKVNGLIMLHSVGANMLSDILYYLIVAETKSSNSNAYPLVNESNYWIFPF